MSDWLAYDWEVQGKSARFVVDLSFENYPAEYNLLLYCAVAPLPPKNAFHSSELGRVNKLEGKLLRKLPDALYVGHIHMDSVRQYYFYIRDQALAEETLEPLTMKERKLSMDYGIKPEPAWTTYTELLYPDAAKYQTTLNAALLEQQQKAGDSMDAVRKLTLLMAFHSEPDKLLFQEKARMAGFAIGESGFVQEMPLPCLLSLHILSALDKQNIDRITTHAIRLAEAYHGEMIRWTTPRVSRRNPRA